MRNARSDAAMRLEGSHPALLANLGKNVAKPSLTEKKLPASKWSADTEAPDQGLRQSPSATTVSVLLTLASSVLIKVFQVKQPSDERVYKVTPT